MRPSLTYCCFLTIIFCCLCCFGSIQSQEFGVNFNESLHVANNLKDLKRTETTWTKGFFDFFQFYDQPDRLLTDPGLKDFLSLQDHGFKVILNLKFNFKKRDFPAIPSEEATKYQDFLIAVLDQVWGKVDILVVGNEPFIESKPTDWNTKLLPFYQLMAETVQAYRVGKEQKPIYMGAFNKLYDPSFIAQGTDDLLSYIKNTPWIAGADIHPHHKTMEEMRLMYEYVNDRIRKDQKIIMTEFSIVWWWKDHFKNSIPTDFAKTYNYDPQMKNWEYLNHTLEKGIRRSEWVDFLSSSTWFENRKRYLKESFDLVTSYPNFHVGTYSYKIGQTSFTANGNPWIFNSLYQIKAIQPSVEGTAFNYALIDDFWLIARDLKEVTIFSVATNRKLSFDDKGSITTTKKRRSSDSSSKWYVYKVGENQFKLRCSANGYYLAQNRSEKLRLTPNIQDASTFQFIERSQGDSIGYIKTIDTNLNIRIMEVDTKRKEQVQLSKEEDAFAQWKIKKLE